MDDEQGRAFWQSAVNWRRTMRIGPLHIGPLRRPATGNGDWHPSGLWRSNTYELDRTVRTSVVALTGLYLVWALTFVRMPRRYSAADAWWCLGAAAAVGALAAAGFRRPLRPVVAERMVLAVVMLLGVTTASYLVQTGDPKVITNVMLLVVAAAVALGSVWSFGTVVAMALGTWVYGWATIGSADWSYFGVATGSSIVVAVAVFATRRSCARRLAEAHAELRDMAVVDELTGLHNRRGFDVLAEQAMLDADRSGARFTLLFVEAGRAGADDCRSERSRHPAALRETASLLRSAFRGADVVARLSGGEFCVLLPAASPGVSYPDRLRSAVIEANAVDGRTAPLAVTVEELAYDPARPVPVDELLASRRLASPRRGR
jgi:diguanylate cyclase (GGDEF)-like protein